ncbi:SLBB domain-containing protein [Microvirga sp. SRT01]|jgi:polysaccharide export outer membrane protein|uniref:SLBB domain-containing protein n=1 Tax=Sphingomonas longa TaxID=2778730 RepID=A0ABS2D3I5_9SPHN|nr:MULTISPECIES: SLBB domain-containing protein [Alphaproteobacteria]MBM6575460.1 SLBB domain-containing protein [Sphingomonas sp. BT552]MBR7708508.1 SLBB domain-containing protein [Microvirga sp. SRT01]
MLTQFWNTLAGSAGTAAILALSMPAVATAQSAPVRPTASTPPTAATAPAAKPTGDTGYILGTGDVIEVNVVGREDYKARVRVQTDGTVALPLIGSLTATGKTTLQLSADIVKALKAGGYYEKPVISVEIASYSSRYVTVLGEVGSPGLVPIDRAYRVSEILARVGGAKPSAADDLTLRRATGEELKLPIVALATGGEKEDPYVNPGDKLFLASAETFYIYGQVAAPGVYKVDTDMSLRKALARGGGLTPSGSEKRVKVFRDGQEMKKVDLNAPITPGDVVVVGERLF